MLYFTFFNEIHYAWHLQIDDIANNNHSAVHYRVLSLIIYTLLFVTALLEFNGRKIKVRSVDDRLLIGGIFITLFFLTKGLFTIGELRDIYIAQSKTNNPSFWMLGIRYLCLIALAIFYFAEWRAVKRIATPNSTKIFALIFNITLLAIICNEFVHWMDIAGFQNQYKLGLTIICGLYALVLVFVGIIKKHQHLRVGSIALFTLTLLKLFFYDLSSLSTISKTVVLVVLGIILLIVSFLYNKYKGVILGDD